MAERLAEVGKNLALYKVHVDEIKEQDVNAQVMPPEMLERLTDTVRKEGRLEQLPFCVMRRSKAPAALPAPASADGSAPGAVEIKGDGTEVPLAPALQDAQIRIHFELISGHHRLRAARAAGLTELYIIADERDLPRSKVVAKQLAHNRISGESDKQILARLYAELDAVDDVLESYVKPQDFDDVRQLEPSDIANMSLLIEWRHLNMVFLPKSMAKLDKLELWAKKIPRETQDVAVVSNDVFERFRDVVLAIGRAENVRALGTVVGKMLDICEEYIDTNKIPIREELAKLDAAAAEAKAAKAKGAKGKGGKGKRAARPAAPRPAKPAIGAPAAPATPGPIPPTAPLPPPTTATLGNEARP